MLNHPPQILTALRVTDISRVTHRVYYYLGMNLIRYAYHSKRGGKKSTGNQDICLVFSNLDIYIFAIIGSHGQNGL